jgi:hypothetical protein
MPVTEGAPAPVGQLAPPPGYAKRPPPTPEQIAARQEAAARVAKAIADAKAKPTPRAADGKVDLAGIWTGAGGPNFNMVGRKVGGDVIFEFDEYYGGKAPLPADGPKYKPEELKKVIYNDEHSSFVDKTFRCGKAGVPRNGPPQQIIQTPTEVVFLYAELAGQTFRVIPTDGRGFRDEIDASLNGDSVGRWEGDTLVVETRNFTDETWLGGRGYHHTDKMTVVERLSRQGDVLTYALTVNDPDVLAQPWNATPRQLMPTATMLEEPPPCEDIVGDHLVNTDNHS